MSLRLISMGILFLLSSCIFRDERSEHVKIAEKLRGQISREIQQKFHVTQIGSGGGMRDTVNLICLAFDYRNPTMTQDEARELIVPILQLFLQRINENEEIRPYLKNYPFLIDNIEVSIIIHDYEGRILVDPSVAIVSSCLGDVSYAILHPEGLYKEKNKYRETYAEAIEKYNKNLGI